MNYDEQIKKLETSFYTFIFEEESNKKLKKNDVREKGNFGFVILFYREAISIFLQVWLLRHETGHSLTTLRFFQKQSYFLYFHLFFDNFCF